MKPVPALAEQVQEDNKRTDYLKEIVVTAQKRAEDIQDVPMSITTFSREDMKEANITNVAEVTKFSPNVYMYQAQGENVVVMRGIYSFMASIYSPVGLFIDGVAMPIHQMHNQDLYGVERVEVLRGPQGTLYGQNTESGVINIITRQPDNELRANVFGDVAMYDTPHGGVPYYRLGGSLSAPLVQDKLAAGFSGQVRLSDGFTRNEYTDEDDAAKIDRLDGRFTLRWTPAESWDIGFIGDFQDWDDKNGRYRYLDGYRKAEYCAINWNAQNRLEDKGNGQALKVNYQADSYQLTSITGRREFHSDNVMDSDCSFLNWGEAILGFDVDLLSQELRLASPDDNGNSPLTWLAGMYVFSEDTEIKRTFTGRSQKRRLDSQSTGEAVFGQATYTFRDRLHITAGLRLDLMQKEGDYSFSQESGKTDFGDDIDSCELLPKLAVSYDIRPQLTTYASISRGYLAGGFSHAFAINTDTLAYDPEYSLNYELGVKGKWLDSKLIGDLSLYYIQIKDKQVMEISQEAFVNYVRNAAEAFSRGMELSLNWFPLPGLSLQGGVGLCDAQIDRWTAVESDGSTYDYSGKDMPNAPDYTYNLSAQYLSALGMFSRVDIIGVGRVYYDSKNEVEADPFVTVNAQLGYQANDWDMTLWVKNLFDKEYYNAMFDWGGAELVQDAPPRMIGVSFSYKW